MCGCIGNCILARAPIRPNSAWKALGVIGPSRSVIKTCEDGPCSRCRRRSARISSPCIGWTLGEPFFALRTCSRPVASSTCDHRRSHNSPVWIGIPEPRRLPWWAYSLLHGLRVPDDQMHYPSEVPNRAAGIFRMAGHMLGERLLHRRGLVVSLVDDDPQTFPLRRGYRFASMRSIREALGFMGAGPLARSVCPVASNPVGDLVHAGFELL